MDRVWGEFTCMQNRLAHFPEIVGTINHLIIPDVESIAWWVTVVVIIGSTRQPRSKY